MTGLVKGRGWYARGKTMPYPHAGWWRYTPGPSWRVVADWFWLLGLENWRAR